ncbi:hypothetical protein HYALB_00007814 [Hymenoscyphus albidus]|uniref:Calmodulin n=1 Tax=Hymenoscyphus albidus TaxID=595503 RepID=A0A9N9LDT6_9HELO|nr:hypothetical protein HYALB_00007814 [Hymenoscyphus albidus]
MTRFKMARSLSKEEIAIFKAEFDVYDQDKGGNITVEEFGRVMKASGQKVTDEELAQIVKEVDLDGDGTINFQEFIMMMTGGAAQIAPSGEAQSASSEESAKKE